MKIEKITISYGVRPGDILFMWSILEFKYDSFVNIEDSLLFIHEKMQENVFVQNVEYDYLMLLHFLLLFLLCLW